jgi:hypothetical protein
MAEVDGRFIKLGFWTNLEQTRSWEVQLPPPLEQELSSSLSWLSCRPSLGNQLRLHATYLLRTGTSHLWNLFTFAYHQVRATGRPPDGLFRQQQAILRTRPSPSSLMADSAKLWWLWKKRSNRVLLRSLPQFLLAFLCAVGSIAASISSSYVVSSSELKVLVSSPSCGHVNSSQPINALRTERRDPIGCSAICTGVLSRLNPSPNKMSGFCSSVHPLHVAKGSMSFQYYLLCEVRVR